MKKWDPCGSLASASIICGPQCFRHISQASACCWAIQGTAWVSTGFDYENKGCRGRKGVPRIKQSHATLAENLVGMRKQDTPSLPCPRDWRRGDSGMRCSVLHVSLPCFFSRIMNAKTNSFCLSYLTFFFPIWSTLVSVGNLPRK